MPINQDKNELICYCFGYSVNDIEADAITNGRSLITGCKAVLKLKITIERCRDF